MKAGRRGLTVKWLAALCAALFVGGGNVLGVMAEKMVYELGWVDGMALSRWTVTLSIWASGLIISALTYGLGEALGRIDALEMWVSSLDMTLRNRS